MEAVILTLELDTTQFIIGHMYTMLDPKMTWKKKGISKATYSTTTVLPQRLKEFLAVGAEKLKAVQKKILCHDMCAVIFVLPLFKPLQRYFPDKGFGYPM